MTYTIDDIEKLALAHLSTEERNLLSVRLRSGGPEQPIMFEDDPEFLKELERRVKSIEDGTAVLYPYEEVMAELRARHK
jgi:hypothetical protein